MARQWATTEPDSAAESPTPDAQGGVRLLAVFLALGILGAVWLGASLRRASHAGVVDAASPGTVLVAIQGTPQDPGFTGFLVQINPNRRQLPVTPVAGSLPARHGRTLNRASTSASAAQLYEAVRRDAGHPITGYFILPITVVQRVLNTLARKAPAWPKNLAPATALAALGWHARVRSRTVLRIFKVMLSSVPQLENAQTGIQSVVLGAKETDLSAYQLYLLATYVRGLALRDTSWRTYQRHAR